MGVTPVWSISKFIRRIKDEDVHESAWKTVDFYANRLANYYGLNCVPPHRPCSYVEARTPSLAEFGNLAFEEVTKVDGGHKAAIM